MSLEKHPVQHLTFCIMENIYPNVKQLGSIGETRGGVMPTQLQKNTAARAGGEGEIQQRRRFAGGHLGRDTLNITRRDYFLQVALRL
jgi:hypothetical protein